MVDSNNVKKLQLANYEVGETLGTGSFGRVRIARNQKTGNYIALKIMKKVEIIRSKQTDHIMSEIKILAMINHPFIIQFDGFTQDERSLYLALELVNGGELFTYLRGIGKFVVEQAQ
jgi:serine/threonine protein kinase